MNGRASRQERAQDDREYRARVIALIEQQKGVIGALARAVTHLQDEFAALKRQIAERAE